MSARRVLTVDQVASELAVSYGHAWRLVHLGQLPAFRVGTGARAPLRVRVEDVEAFKARMSVTPETAAPSSRRPADLFPEQRAKAARAVLPQPPDHESECARLGIPPDHEFM